jgi:hypothetical protein
MDDRGPLEGETPCAANHTARPGTEGESGLSKRSCIQCNR